MKTVLAAMLAFAAPTIALDSARAWESYVDAAAPSTSLAQTNRGSYGYAASLTGRTYGLRCTLTAGPDSSEHRRPLRWLLNRCRPWAA